MFPRTKSIYTGFGASFVKIKPEIKADLNRCVERLRAAKSSHECCAQLAAISRGTQPSTTMGALRRLVAAGTTAALTCIALAAFYQLEVPEAPSKLQPLPKHQLRPPVRTAKHHDRQVPPQAQKHFYSQPRTSHTGAALLKRGWRQTQKPEEAELLWYQRKQLIDWGRVQKWQLVNHVRRERDIGHKRNLAHRLRDTPAQRWVPETYDLSDTKQAAAFAKVALSETAPAPGAPPGWLAKRPGTDGGKGIELLHEARDALDGRSVKRTFKDRLAQRYVSDLLLTPDGRKFDLRVYWVVASFRPELLLYYGGTLRVSASNFTGEGNGVHLTNAAQQKGGHGQSDASTRRPLQALWDQLSTEQRPGWPADPAAYVDCSIRKTVQDVWRAYENDEHLLAPRETHDAFILLGLDVMVDAELNVYLSEVQSGCGLPTNTKAVRDVVTKLVPDLLDVVLKVKDANYLETPPHASAVKLAEERGFEVLANNGETPEPWACRGL